MNKNKITLIGDGAVGKTTLVRKLQTGEFRKKYIATLGVEVHPIKRNTTNGPICYNMWDTAGQEKFGGLREGYFIQSNAAIVMFDRTSLVTFKNVSTWVKLYQSVAPNTPIILCGNKCDITNAVRVTSDMAHEYANQVGVTYLDISAKTEHNVETLLETLANELSRNPVALVTPTNKPTYAIPDISKFL